MRISNQIIFEEVRISMVEYAALISITNSNFTLSQKFLTKLNGGRTDNHADRPTAKVPLRYI